MKIFDIPLFDIMLLLILSFTIVSGYRRGLVRQLVDLVGFFAALYLAGIFGPGISLYISMVVEYFPSLGNGPIITYIINLVGFLVAYALARAIFTVLGKLLHDIASLPVLGVINSTGGALVGTVKGVILVIIIVGIVSVIPGEFYESIVRDSFLSAVVYSYLPVLIDMVKGVFSFNFSITV